MKVFNTRMRSLRKSLKLTQEELAKRANTTIANISCYETGNQNPSLNMMLRLSDSLGCSIDYLLGRSNKLYVQEDQDQVITVELAQKEKYIFLLEDGTLLNETDLEEMIEYVHFKRMLKEKKQKVNINQELIAR